MWIYLTMLSAVLLGVYDICRKSAVNANAVLPTIFATTTCAALLAGQAVIGSYLFPDQMREIGLYIPPLPFSAHVLLMLKSVIVGGSWVCTFFAVKHLPITIAVPIRASAPLWTLLGAVIIFGETFLPLQWVGLLIVFISYYAFSLQGKREGIVFWRNPWIFIVLLGMILGAGSALYDKYLMQFAVVDGEGFNAATVLAYFLIYLAVLMGIVVMLVWYPRRGRYSPFRWRWSVPLVGVFLVGADLAYFSALNDPEAMVGIVSALRRTSVVVSFVVGALVFREANRWRKGAALLGVLIGGALIIYAK